MINHQEFHDGAFEGLWVDGATGHVHVCTVKAERFTLVLNQIAALSLNGFKAGNIVFEVITRECAEVTKQDIRELYQLPDGAAGEDQADRLLEKVERQRLKVLEINPSYGGRLIALTVSVDLVPRAVWIEQLLMSGVAGT